MNQHSTFQDGQDIRDRSFNFACRVVKLCERLCSAPGVGRIMAPQLLRCSTSIAAMLEEARAAESRRDFISKCSIALKESRESHVRLRIHEACCVGPAAELPSLRQEAHEIMSIIGAIVRNTRRNGSDH
jgi:four helix bundle protein